MSTWDVIQGDCVEVLKSMGGVPVDAVVTDPPYGIDVLKPGQGFFTGPNGSSAKFWGPIIGDDRPFDPTHLLSLAPKLVFWGANHYADKLPPSARWLVWDKREGRRSNPLADCEMAWTNDTRPARLFSYMWIGACREGERGEHYHPTQKPVKLLEWAMDVMEIPVGALVVDPYCGSGSTGVACVRTGRNFIGIEKDPKYYEVARRRIGDAANHLFAEQK